MPLPDLVIFDCDGVLVDSEPAAQEVLLADLAERGLTLDRARAETLFTGGTLAQAGEQARAMGAHLPEDWLETTYERLYERLALGVPVIDGVIGLLDRLDAAGVPHCVGSNGAERKMRITLTPSGLWHRFSGRIYSAQTHGMAKPDPGLFLLAARDFGVDPARVAVIDDSPSGVRAGQAAGMFTIGYSERTDPWRLQAHGASIARTMDEAATLLGLAP